ncbi:Major Facilitator Superfamily protein [Duganella sp. CF517]|uniref:MFS transporter n=1 Tax=Duganella sp. CF517 TaxID=1881038 RepID=UPI0008CD41BB|nr:MFS transporter [Duganella sp. CF517]SEO01836.1 Major Facilitator Superfamily protein [Duganella sp. CF517]
MSEPIPARAALLREPNFKWLLRGGVISMLGDQLTMIALPWLVFRLTGDTVALGLVIALMSIPRAVFILVGGALVDRHSPRRVLMLSKYANAALLAVLTLLVLDQRPAHTLDVGAALSLTVVMTPHLTLMAIYALAFGIGLAQAFGIPSGTSIMPLAIAPQQLQAANGMLMGLRQLSMLAGPLIAAGLLAIGGDGGHLQRQAHGAGPLVADARGLALAFGLDCLSFLVSAWTLSKVRLLAAPPSTPAPASVLRAVGDGLAMVWRDVPLRTCFIYWGAVSLLIGGAMQVGLPVLSAALHGAATLGLLMGVHGAGTLLGMGAAALGGARLRFASFGTLLLLIDGAVGLLVMPLGAVDAVWQAASLMLAIGVLAGFMQINVFTWIQRRVPPHMMGRAMSIFMFIFMGLAPLSAGATGWLLTMVPLSQLFAGGGMILVLCAALAYVFTPMRRITNA